MKTTYTQDPGKSLQKLLEEKPKQKVVYPSQPIADINQWFQYIHTTVKK